ncbi:hypothetical protein GCM10023237_61540 [Streptomyces coeruleoprunus]
MAAYGTLRDPARRSAYDVRRTGTTPQTNRPPRSAPSGRGLLWVGPTRVEPPDDGRGEDLAGYRGIWELLLEWPLS